MIGAEGLNGRGFGRADLEREMADLAAVATADLHRDAMLWSVERERPKPLL